MAARGQDSKNAITEIILNTFMDSFINGKEIRIPMIEDGVEVQIKVTLTAAKENVDHPTTPSAPAQKAIPPAVTAPPTEIPTPTPIPTAPTIQEPTAEEKKSLEQLLAALL